MYIDPYGSNNNEQFSFSCHNSKMHNGYLLKLFGKLVDNLLLLFLLSRIKEDVKLWILDEALSPRVGGVGVRLLFEDLRPPPPPPGGGGGGAHLEKVAPPPKETNRLPCGVTEHWKKGHLCGAGGG